jgi:hypothetical protein
MLTLDLAFFFSQIQVKHEKIKVVPTHLRDSKRQKQWGAGMQWAQGLVQCYTMTQIHQDTCWNINI